MFPCCPFFPLSLFVGLFIAPFFFLFSSSFTLMLLLIRCEYFFTLLFFSVLC